MSPFAKITRFKVAMLAATLVVVAVAGWMWRGRANLDQLIATAYSRQRTMELRIEGAPHTALRRVRGVDASSLSRPQELLEANAQIGKRLREHPGDARLLQTRGRADLLESSYEDAIADLQMALDGSPQSASVLNDLATAYFERAELEPRVADYGLAYELQSRALGASPDDPVILFNRAVTAERLSLYQQSLEDWQHYLRVDGTGEWADEARQRMNDVRTVLGDHARRTQEPLLPAEEFARQTVESDPQTWDRVDARIEDYLYAGLVEWLPAAYRAGAPPDSAERRALRNLAAILQGKHTDGWLADALAPKRESGRSGEAWEALSRAIVADNDTEDYATGLKQAKLAESLFAGWNPAGELRAEFEEVYSLHFNDAMPECVQKSGLLEGKLPAAYRWLQVQLRLERRLCLGGVSDWGPVKAMGVRAYEEAEGAHYPALKARALGALTSDEVTGGRNDAAWQFAAEGLRDFWSGNVKQVYGYNIYTILDYLCQTEHMWRLDVAVGEQGLALLSGRETPMTRAVEHAAVARAAVMSDDVARARSHLQQAGELLALAPQDEAAEHYRLTADVYRALLDAYMGHAEEAAARLERVRPRLAGMKNSLPQGEFYRAAGESQQLARNFSAAEREFQYAIALAEKDRNSLNSESDRLSWTHQWAGTYLELMDVMLQERKSQEALAVWSLYRSQRRRTAGDKPGEDFDAEKALQQLQTSLQQESEALHRSISQWKDRTRISLALVPHGLAVWTLDDRGVSFEWRALNPDDLRLQARQLGELCSKPGSPAAAVEELSRGLYRSLMGGIEGQLRPRQRVVIDADQSLSEIPFQALQDEGGVYLAEKHPVAYAAGWSLGADDQGEKAITASMRLLSVASATGAPGLRPLADALNEARAVSQRFQNAQLLVEDEASPAQLHSGLEGAEIFHFAGHAGEVGGERGLLLNGRRGAVALDASMVEGWSMPNIRLAVLSACSTDRGRVEGAESVAQAFLTAGAHDVVATRWDVDSATSTAMMQQFYDLLLSGHGIAEALAMAESSMRARTPEPYYWAGFEVFER